MNANVTYNKDAFASEMRRIMALTNQSLEKQIKEQMGNFVRDAISMTPPFGKKPLTEGQGVQKKAGVNAVRRDVTQRGFRPLTDLRLYSGMARAKSASGRTKKEYSDLGKQLRKAVKQSDFYLADALLRKSKIRTQGVIPSPTKFLKESMRQMSSGRIQRRISYLTVTKDSKNKLFSKTWELKVGLAKSGWMKAARWLAQWLGATNRLRERMPTWVMLHNGGGFLHEYGKNQDNYALTVANSVAYVQKMEPLITEKAWNSRMRNIQKQRASIEAYFRRKAAGDPVMKGSVK